MLAVRLSYKNGMGAWPSRVKSYTRRKQRLHYTYSKKVATLAINLSTILKFSSCVLFKCHYHQALKLNLGAWRRRCPASSIIKLLPAASGAVTVPFMPGGHLTLTSWHKFRDHGKTCNVHFLALFLELLTTYASHCNCIVNLPYVSVTFQAMQLSVSDKNLRVTISGRKYRPVQAPATRQTCPSRVSLAPEATVLVALVGES